MDEIEQTIKRALDIVTFHMPRPVRFHPDFEHFMHEWPEIYHRHKSFRALDHLNTAVALSRYDDNDDMDRQFIVHYLMHAARFLRRTQYDKYCEYINHVICKVKCGREHVILASGDFRFEPGINVIMGPQGIGKSRVIRSLTGSHEHFVFVPGPKPREDGWILMELRTELCELFMFYLGRMPSSDGFNRLRRLQGIALSKNCVPGAQLFWRNPEAYLHPMNVMILAKILLALERLGVQIFIETNDYVLVRSIDLFHEDGNTVRFISIDDDGRHYSYEKYPDVLPDFIKSAYDRLNDAENLCNLGVLQ